MKNLPYTRETPSVQYSKALAMSETIFNSKNIISRSISKFN